MKGNQYKGRFSEFLEPSSTQFSLIQTSKLFPSPDNTRANDFLDLTFVMSVLHKIWKECCV